MERDNFKAKVHFVAGKGGVGKTLISQALATFFSQFQNKKTLLVSLSEEESDRAKEIAVIKENVSQNLSYIKIYPDQALYEYLCLKVPSKKVMDKVLSKKLFQSLCSAMPGLVDLTRLGKIWFHADEEHGSDNIYEKIVVDMPSSGFVSRFLSIASVVKNAVKIGPLAKQASLMQNYFANRANSVLHLVSLLEELVINETLELYDELKNNPETNLGVLFINRKLNLDLDDNAKPDISPKVFKVLQFFLQRQKEEELQQQRLVTKTNFLQKIVFFDQIGEMDEKEIIKEMTEVLLRISAC